MCARAVDEAAELLRSLGHEVAEVDPPWQIEGVAEMFGAVFCIYISLAILASGMIAGHEPAVEDMEPMSWAIYSMVQELNATQGLGVVAQLQAFARRLIAFLEPYDMLLTTAPCSQPPSYTPLGSDLRPSARGRMSLPPRGLADAGLAGGGVGGLAVPPRRLCPMPGMAP